MENKGNRFKKNSESSPKVNDAEPVFSENSEKSELRRAKQSKKVEKMLQKKRRHEITEEPREEAQAAVEEEAVSLDDLPQVDPQPEPDAEKEPDAKQEPEPDPAPVKARHAQDERLKEKNSKKLEKLLKKQRKREENSDREVLSFEEMPLEERASDQKQKKVRFKRKRIILAAVVLVLLIGLVFLFTNSDRLSMHNITNFIRYGIFNADSDQRFPVEIRDEVVSSGNFCRMGQDLCYATGTKLETLNNYGKKMLTVSHGYSKPFLVCCDKYSLLYNLGGKDFQINSLTEQVYVDQAQSNILVADIINNGTYALVTQSDGYLSKLFVYNSDNDRIFSYSFSEYYVTSVSLKSNGKMAVVAGISAHNGSEISSIYVLDFTKDTPVYFLEIEDTVIYDVRFLGSTYAAAVGSSGAYVIDTGDGEVNRTDYEGKMLTAYTFNTDTDTFSVSLSRSGDGRNCDIYSFSTSGELSKSFSTDLRVISLSSYKNRVALLTTDTVYLYSKDGELVGSESSGIDPCAVELYTSADAYVLDTSEIRSVSM